MGFRYSEKDRFFLISGCVFWSLGYILYMVGRRSCYSGIRGNYGYAFFCKNKRKRGIYVKKKMVNMLIAAAVSICMAAAPVSAATWVKDGKGWWYQEDNGSWPANQWKQVNGQWYWFDSNGYMATGWRQIGGTWYYLMER